jgi:hypothetical protein
MTMTPDSNDHDPGLGNPSSPINSTGFSPNLPYEPSTLTLIDSDDRVAGDAVAVFFESFEGAVALCDLIREEGTIINETTDNPTTVKLDGDFSWTALIELDYILNDCSLDGKRILMDDILNVADREVIVVCDKYVVLTEKWWDYILYNQVAASLDEDHRYLYYIADPEDRPGYGVWTADGACGNKNYKAYEKRRKARKAASANEQAAIPSATPTAMACPAPQPELSWKNLSRRDLRAFVSVCNLIAGADAVTRRDEIAEIRNCWLGEMFVNAGLLEHDDQQQLRLTDVGIQVYDQHQPTQLAAAA